MNGKICNSPNRYPSVPLYRTGETWLHRIDTRDAKVYLVRVSDDSIHGPFKRLDDAEKYIARNGGGYLDWGSSSIMIGSAPEGQIALLHHSNGTGLGWFDWQHCEEHPRAFASCGHDH